MSKTKILIHAVFATKCREKSLNPEFKRDLYNYIHSIITANKCHTIRINGMSDHIHILLDLNPGVALSGLMYEIKRSTSLWMKKDNKFMKFKGWGEGYYAVSIGVDAMDSCRNYIINQENHHYRNEFLSEIEYLIKSVELGWYPDDWD